MTQQELMDRCVELYLDGAKASDPDGATCHFCGQPNTNVDDCGFFYILDPSKPIIRDGRGWIDTDKTKIYPACDACYRKHCWLHHKMYGVGDR